MRYIAEGGKVFAVEAEGRREVGTAVSADGRDLEAFDRALNEARDQRDRIVAGWKARPDKEQFPHPSRVASGGALGIADRCAFCPMIAGHEGGHLSADDVEDPA